MFFIYVKFHSFFVLRLLTAFLIYGLIKRDILTWLKDVNKMNQDIQISDVEMYAE